MLNDNGGRSRHSNRMIPCLKTTCFSWSNDILSYCANDFCKLHYVVNDNRMATVQFFGKQIQMIILLLLRFEVNRE